MKYDTDSNLEEILARYRRTLDLLRDFGIRLPDSSRLCVYHKRMASTLSQQGQQLVLKGQQADQILFDSREMDEISLIVENLQTNPTATELAKLQVMVGGSENPDSDHTTKARDTQFELFLYAAFRNAGAIVNLEEPDLIVSSEGIVFPIAAKRPTSRERIDDKLRRAVSQLERSDRLGVAALSLDQVIRPREAILSVPDRDSLGPSVQLEMHKFLSSNLRTIVKRVRNKPLAALLFVLRSPARAQDTNLSLLGSALNLAPIDALEQPGAEVVTVLQKLLLKFDL